MTAETQAAPEFLTLGTVARRYSKAVSTVGRWISNGVWRHGRLVKLRAIQLGGTRSVRPEWVEEFLAACNDGGEPVSTETPAAEQRRRRHEQAQLAKKLKSKG